MLSCTPAVAETILTINACNQKATLQSRVLVIQLKPPGCHNKVTNEYLYTLRARVQNTIGGHKISEILNVRINSTFLRKQDVIFNLNKSIMHRQIMSPPEVHPGCVW